MSTVVILSTTINGCTSFPSHEKGARRGEFIVRVAPSGTAFGSTSYKATTKRESVLSAQINICGVSVEREAHCITTPEIFLPRFFSTQKNAT